MSHLTAKRRTNDRNSTGVDLGLTAARRKRLQGQKELRRDAKAVIPRAAKLS